MFFEFMFNSFTVNVLLYLLLLLEVEPKDKALAYRAVSFDDIRNGYVLRGHSLKKYSKISKSGCAKRCLADPACLSFNHCESQQCELNLDDIHSKNVLLERWSSCSYWGMRREEAVICEEMGIFRSLSQNSAADHCKLELKKHDVNWSSWEKIVERSNSSIIDGVLVEEYKDIKVRVCLDMPAHGNNCEGEDVRVEWFKVVQSRMNWTEAKAACENLGGKLFSELQQSIDQNAVARIPYNVWTGITWDGNGSWRSLQGRVLPNHFLNWADGQPDGSPLLKSERAVRIRSGRSYDESYSTNFFPLCDVAQSSEQTD